MRRLFGQGRRGDGEFLTRRIDLPRNGLRNAAGMAGMGWGPGVVADPDRPVALYGRPWGRSPSPWTLVDLESGSFEDVQGREGLPGDLRDGWIEAGGRRAWLLCSHGVVDLNLEARAPRAVAREGVGTYLWRLFPLGPELLGATGWNTKSIAVVDRQPMRFRARLQFPSPDLVVSIDAGSVALLAFQAGTGAVLDLERLRIRDRFDLPTATGPVVVGNEIIVFAGARGRADGGIDGDEIWQIEIARPLALDGRTFRVVREGPLVGGLGSRWKSLTFRAGLTSGVERSGAIVAQTSAGVAWLDSVSLEVMGLWPGDYHQVTWSTPLQSAVVLGGRWSQRDELVVVGRPSVGL